MSNKYERGQVIGLGATDDYCALPVAAQRLLALCVELADKDGLVPLSRREAAKRLGLAPITVHGALQALEEKDFVAQVDEGLVAMNFTRVWITTRYVDGDAALRETFDRRRRGWLYSRGQKSAAAKASMDKRKQERTT